VSDDAGTERDQSDSAPTEAPRAERPTVETPTVDVPSPETPATEPETLQELGREVNTEFRVFFWKTVFVYKFGLLGFALGALLISFEGNYAQGGPLAVGGGALLAYGLYLTWQGKRKLDADEFDLDPDSEPPEGWETSDLDSDSTDGGEPFDPDSEPAADAETFDTNSSMEDDTA